MSTPPNPLPCGCRSVGTLHLDGYGSEYTLVQTYRDVHVQHCPLHAQAEGMRDALESIARNTCCLPCQEAASVAARALGKYHCWTCGALNDLVNQCGCDPNNMPTRALLRAVEGRQTP